MKKLPDIMVMVHLDVVGERTKTRWHGEFKIKRILAHSDVFALERMYAKLLPSGVSPSDELKMRAAAIAELSVRVVESPNWWEGSKGGQLLLDSDPLYELIRLCSEEEKRWSQLLEQEAQETEPNAVPVPEPSQP